MVWDRLWMCPVGRPRGRGLGGMAVLAVVALSLGSCDVLSSGENSRSANQYVSQSMGSSALVSTTAPARLSLRNGWQAAPANTLHPSADMQAYHPGQDMFLLVLAEPVSAVPSGNLEDQASRYLDLMESGLDRVLSDRRRTQVDRVSNFPAVQHEIQGEVLTRSVAYLHTTIQMDERYYQVVVWTPESRFIANAADMRAVVQGFGPAQR